MERYARRRRLPILARGGPNSHCCASVTESFGGKVANGFSAFQWPSEDDGALAKRNCPASQTPWWTRRLPGRLSRSRSATSWPARGGRSWLPRHETALPLITDA